MWFIPAVVEPGSDVVYTGCSRAGELEIGVHRHCFYIRTAVTMVNSAAGNWNISSVLASSTLYFK